MMKVSTRYVWVEQNTVPAPDWLMGVVERYSACAYTPIVTTSPGREYVSLYRGLPEYVIGGAKLCNALSTIDDDPGWWRVADGIKALVELRHEVGGPWNGTLLTYVLECETLLQQHYWQNPNPREVLLVLCDNLRKLPPARYVFYPGFGRDYYADFNVRMKDLTSMVAATLPGVTFTDSEFAYQPFNPTWGTGAKLIRSQVAKKPTWSLVYTESFNYRGSGFSRIGWPNSTVHAKMNELADAGKIGVLYPGGNYEEVVAPLGAMEE